MANTKIAFNPISPCGVPCPTTLSCGPLQVQVEGCSLYRMQSSIVQLFLGTTLVDSGTTDLNGNINLNYNSGGTYTLKVLPPSNSSRWATDPITQSITLVCGFTIHIYGCIQGSLGGVGATVLVTTLDNNIVFNGTTDANSDISIGGDVIDNNTLYNVRITPSGVRQSIYNLQSLPGNISIFLLPAPDYTCMTAINQLPIKKVLQCVDSARFGDGTFDLTSIGGGHSWVKGFNPGSYELDNSGRFFLNGTTARTSLISSSWPDSGSALHLVYQIVPGQGDATHPVGTTFTITEK